MSDNVVTGNAGVIGRVSRRKSHGKLAVARIEYSSTGRTIRKNARDVGSRIKLAGTQRGPVSDWRGCGPGYVWNSLRDGQQNLKRLRCAVGTICEKDCVGIDAHVQSVGGGIQRYVYRRLDARRKCACRRRGRKPRRTKSRRPVKRSCCKVRQCKTLAGRAERAAIGPGGDEIHQR